MSDQISNAKLLDQKKTDLKRFKKGLSSIDFPFSISCLYHGIELNFKCQSERFVQSLKKLIPADWVVSPNELNCIYMMPPEFFGHGPEEWCSESSQDCLSYENNTIAVQRDFASMISDTEVLLICDDQVGDGFYNFLRWYLSEKLMAINKFVVHASCVLDKNNEAHLFLGHSGAGKTTITQLSAPRLVLGDDMNLVSFSNGHLYVEAGAIGGLFNSMIGYDKKMPVKACYWLTQASKNSLISLNPLEANQKFLASFANLHWPTLSDRKIEQLMSFSLEVSALTKFYELNFTNTPDIWKLLDP